MKILISEQQLRLIISESYDDDRLNYLLDKINAMGMAALTDKEKKTLDSISKGEEPDDDSEEEMGTHRRIAMDSMSHYDPRDDEDSYGMDDDVMDEPFDKPISPEYMDRSDHDDPTDADDDEEANLLGMFMYFNPEFEEITVNGTPWYIQMIDKDDAQHLHVANEEHDFYVTPFWDGKDVVTVEKNDGEKITFKIINNVPVNEKEMKDFIRTFYKRILPKIIEKVV